MEALLPALDYGLAGFALIVFAYILLYVIKSGIKREEEVMQFVLDMQPTQEGILESIKSIFSTMENILEKLDTIEEKTPPRKRW